MNLRRLFVIRGHSESGKTTIIIRLIDMLLNEYGSNIIENRILIENEGESNEERLGTITIQGLKIGFISQGDYYGYTLSKLIELFENENCDIVFCTCRTRQSSFNAVQEYIINNENCIIQFRNTENPWSEIQTNRIVNEIFTWINGINNNN